MLTPLQAVAVVFLDVGAFLVLQGVGLDDPWRSVAAVGFAILVWLALVLRNVSR